MGYQEELMRRIGANTTGKKKKTSSKRPSETIRRNSDGRWEPQRQSYRPKPKVKTKTKGSYSSYKPKQAGSTNGSKPKAKTVTPKSTPAQYKHHGSTQNVGTVSKPLEITKQPKVEKTQEEKVKDFLSFRLDEWLIDKLIHPAENNTKEFLTGVGEGAGVVEKKGLGDLTEDELNHIRTNAILKEVATNGLSGTQGIAQDPLAVVPVDTEDVVNVGDTTTIHNNGGYVPAVGGGGTATEAQRRQIALMSAEELAAKYGITIDEARIYQTLADASDARWNEYSSQMRRLRDQSLTDFGGAYGEYMNNMRQGRANAIQTGAGKGVQAAQEMIAMLGAQQVGGQGQSEINKEITSIADKRATELATNRVKAMDQSNMLRQQLSTLASNLYNADVQNNAAELAYLGQVGSAGIQAAANRYYADQNLAGNQAMANANKYQYSPEYLAALKQYGIIN